VGFVQCGHFANKGEGGVLQMWTSALFGENIGFFEICGVFSRTKGEGD